MNIRRFKTFMASPTARLSATYLAIIMVMSLGFSLVLYNTSSHQLGRQLPPDSLIHNNNSYVLNQDGTTVQPNQDTEPPRLNQFLQNRINEGRQALLTRLVILNIGSLCVGAAVSYALARRSLQPIEEAMEAQSQFVSDASHELRTPLTAIQASNEVFMRRQKLTLTDAKKLIEQNTEDVKRLKQLSDGLLNLAQRDNRQLHVRAVPVQPIISAAMTQIIPQASLKNITVEDTSENISVLADEATLTQVVVILLDNAVKYSANDKSIFITTRTKAKTVYIDVRDEGVGIRASDIPHLFRRFYRADNARTVNAGSGYGLGLAIAKQIMDNHHGDIVVSSAPGKGSTFSLKLPLA